MWKNLRVKYQGQLTNQSQEYAKLVEDKSSEFQAKVDKLVEKQAKDVSDYVGGLLNAIPIVSQVSYLK